MNFLTDRSGRPTRSCERWFSVLSLPLGGSFRRFHLLMTGLIGLLLLSPLYGDEDGVRRVRHEGLHASQSSSTAGQGNLHMVGFGRSFLWDNNAATRIPPTLPNLEAIYGIYDFLDVAAGSRVLSYGLQPGSAYMRLKATTPNNKKLRLFGVGQSLEFSRNLMTFFPSNGYRIHNEGFGPEGFNFGSDALLTGFKAMTALDFEFINISSYLPFKLYVNMGWETGLGSWIADSNAQIAKKPNGRMGTDNFSKMPFSLGLEVKTYSTDFFVELEGDPFTVNMLPMLGKWVGLSEGNPWQRFQVGNKSFDMHFVENPFYLHAGSRLKYGNGLTMLGGFSWLLSSERGADFGPCHIRDNPCQDRNVTDGYNPFYPQWKLFGGLQYPIRFTQPSSELYRSFLLKRYQSRRKIVDIEKALEDTRQDTEQIDGMERRRILEERRKQAEESDVELN